jgi:hypothetical protein
MEDKITHDPENYHKMSVPHESPDLANEALRGFYDDVEAARKKHKIADILIITKDSVKYPDGKIGQFMQHSQYGNSLNAVPMAAFAYGQTQAEHREVINKMLGGGEFEPIKNKK